MKIDPYISVHLAPTLSRVPVQSLQRSTFVDFHPSQRMNLAMALLLMLSFTLGVTAASAQDSPTQRETVEIDPANRAAAKALLLRTIKQIAMGSPFDAKLRQRVWVGGREVVGIGTYEQSGEGLGRFNMQVAMHDGDGKHALQQISDGRLTWTRQQIGDTLTLSRIDVGRLDQWAGEATRNLSTLPPRTRVGGWTELLETIVMTHSLSLASRTFQERDVWIVSGRLLDEKRNEMLEQFSTPKWPELCPTKVAIAIAKENDPDTGFGQGLPIRIEYWTDPIETEQRTGEEDASPLAMRRLVSLVELYSVRAIAPPPAARFRFEHQDLEVTFSNETDRYLERYGIHITERQSKLLRR